MFLLLGRLWGQQMLIKYDIDPQVINKRLKQITNQIYKLLPIKEEGGDWQLPLQTCIEELTGLYFLSLDQQEILFPLLCKLQGLNVLVRPEDFVLYRRTIFDCLNLLGSLKEDVSRNIK